MGRVARYKKASGADKVHSKNPYQFSMGYGFSGSEDRRRQLLAERRILKREKQIARGKVSRKKKLDRKDLVGDLENSTHRGTKGEWSQQGGQLSGSKRKSRSGLSDFEDDKDAKAFREFEKWKLEAESIDTKKKKKRNEQGSNSFEESMVSVQKELQDEVRIARQLVGNKRAKGPRSETDVGTNGGEKIKFLGKQDNESYADFKKRLKSERYQALLKQTQHNERGRQSISSAMRQTNPERYYKKREYLAKRKNRKGTPDNEDSEREDTDDDNEQRVSNDRHDGFITGEQASEAVAALRKRNGGSLLRDLDQVERPPEFKRLPRGAVAKSKAENIIKNNSQVPRQGMDPDSSRKEMADYLSKIQHKYALIKQQRKKRGDHFHL